ncbi:hypothetical protein B0H14DRAFT_2446607 [Mycena olivaceomarginata]|nr:hypothetical protein B0H14DRAFT_2446607 [Mycena olivaceomarginata]
MAEHSYKFDVKMTSADCSGAVTRVLERAKDAGEVSEYTVNLESQEVLVKGLIALTDLEEKISKTGKEIRSSQTLE